MGTLTEQTEAIESFKSRVQGMGERLHSQKALLKTKEDEININRKEINKLKGGVQHEGISAKYWMFHWKLGQVDKGDAKLLKRILKHENETASGNLSAMKKKVTNIFNEKYAEKVNAVTE